MVSIRATTIPDLIQTVEGFLGPNGSRAIAEDMTGYFLDEDLVYFNGDYFTGEINDAEWDEALERIA